MKSIRTSQCNLTTQAQQYFVGTKLALFVNVKTRKDHYITQSDLMGSIAHSASQKF